MKATVSRKALAAGVKIVHRAVSNRSTLPILSYVLVEATERGDLILSATDLEIGIRQWIIAEVKEPGKLAVPGRTFLDLAGVDTNGDDQWKLSELKGEALKMDSGSLASKLKGMPADDFPLMPDPDEDGAVVFQASEFKNALQRVTLAASTDNARPVLTGVLFKFEKDSLILAAADGFRLSKVTMPLPTGADKDTPSAIVPAEALRQLMALIGDADSVRMIVQDSKVIFLFGSTMLVVALIEGNFPDYDQIIPKGSTTSASFSADSMMRSCKAAHIFARESLSNLITLSVSTEEDSKGLVVSAISAETGSNESELKPNSVEGEPLEIGFNVKYLMDFLATKAGEVVIFESKGSSSPGLFRFEGNDDFVHVLMPMHLTR